MADGASLRNARRRGVLQHAEPAVLRDAWIARRVRVRPGKILHESPGG
jgi:hypothetical protein